ncbi:type IA DNA topoisomerase [Desulfosporosinus sp. Sb-LF]|uniref:type IA DNA topoisomerase n=1 Tax=Desulfosporosinus sp. Sb-LF TaxID=2560027 RepID=UPI00107F1905|nr:type IA DNA topoisomerase [Desulfosporosinus sp. Sb-LF]TGE31616.1 type IA DNA topoisomerase [Desulfosporosinus sp. Sb-LF]
MGKTLIVAEKPSQAREYATALGVRGKGDGYIENEQYVITWCYGHLLELERPEAYMNLDRVGKRWSLNRLPVLPGLNAFRRVVKSGAVKQYQVIQRWLKSSDVEDVICGTDADREGQLLFQEVWDASMCSKPLSRLWISSLTSVAIREGLERLLPADSVAGLAAAGHGRAYADWDFGMNLTEGFTSLFGSFDAVRKKPNVISIGRVQTPTLALIVEREWEIERFVSQPYFEVRAELTATRGDYTGKWFDSQEESRRITNRQDAESIVTRTQGKPGKITKMEQKDVQEPAPLLFDLTSLTITASKKYGFSAEKVLQLAQSLYEKKSITYPRTDCAYLSEDLVSKLPDHLKAVKQEPYTNLVDEARLLGVPRSKRVINTITAHHAIIPTTEKVVIERLNFDEQKLYDLIVRRFLAVWFPPARYHQTDVITEVEGERFRTKGKVLLSPGWKKVYGTDEEEEKITRKKKKDDREQSDDENTTLPPLSMNEDVRTKRVFSEEKSTKPPKRFTQGDLLKAMEGAGKQIDDEVLRQQLKGKGLGTVATRPAIMENLIDRGYILQEQKTLKPTEKGTELIRLIKERLPQAQLLISAEMTGQMEFNLSKVEKGELTIERYMADVEEAIGRIIEELRSFEHKHGKTPLALAPTTDHSTGVGKGEGAKVARKKSSKVLKSTKFAREIEETGKPTVIGENGIERVARNNLQATALMEYEKTKTVTSKVQLDVLGICPKCGGDVIEGQKGFGCASWREGCRFVVWKSPIYGKVLTPNQIKSLLKKGKTPLIKGFKSKLGKSFNAYLIWEDPTDAKLKFEFPK